MSQSMDSSSATLALHPCPEPSSAQCNGTNAPALQAVDLMLSTPTAWDHLAFLSLDSLPALNHLSPSQLKLDGTFATKHTAETSLMDLLSATLNSPSFLFTHTSLDLSHALTASLLLLKYMFQTPTISAWHQAVDLTLKDKPATHPPAT